MPVYLRTSRFAGRARQRTTHRLHVETLESRALLSTTAWPSFLHPVSDAGTNETLDHAQSLGDLSITPRAEAVGTIGSAADVDWYSFQLDRPASVTLVSPPALGRSKAITTLSLYNSDNNDFNDLYDPLGYRLIGQADSATQAGRPVLTQRLAAGTYYVAVSGSGNDAFHPFVADSGLAGNTGDYGLLIKASDLGLEPTDGPIVLASDPAPGAALDRSPFVLRVDLSGAVDPSTLVAGGTVQLIENVHGTFGDGNDMPVPLASINFSPAANELQLSPAAPLAPGYYEVLLSGNSTLHAQVVAAPTGTPLGSNSTHPTGVDFAYTFQITANEGNAASGNNADDAPTTSHQLGDLSDVAQRQIAGAIGDDATDPIPFDPADVDLYHFQISGTEPHAFLAEVFAGRIGSPLDPALSLFQVQSDGSLQLVTANDNTFNDTPASNGTSPPLFNDSVLYAGLMPGDYYLAVSGTANVSDPVNGPAPGTNGVFDPTVSHSGQAGFTTGPYLLNLSVHADHVAPQVVQTTPTDGSVLDAPPTNLTVQFSKPINLQAVAYANYQQTLAGALQAVYVVGTNGTRYYPRLLSYDPTTCQAQFQMLDDLASGTYELHLSGAGNLGLVDFAGNRLVGNDNSGDAVVHFTVHGSPRGDSRTPLQVADQEPNNTIAQAQELGILFPNELQNGLTITRAPSGQTGAGLSDSADDYHFQVLQTRDYIISLNGSGLPAGALPTLTDAEGNTVPTLAQGLGGGVRVTLTPGSYVLGVGGWDPQHASHVSYQLHVGLAIAPENPTPLTVGPAPAYRIALAFSPAPAPTTPTNVPTPPPANPSPTPPPSGPTNSNPTPTPSAPSTPAVAPVTPPPPSTPPQESTPPAPPAVVVTTPPAGTSTAVVTLTAPASTVPAPVAPVASGTPAGSSVPTPHASTPAAEPSSVPAAPSGIPPAAATVTLSLPVGPAASAVAVPRVEITVPAETANSAGILFIANYRVGADTSSLSTIPSEVLTGLSALPVGGVRAVVPQEPAVLAEHAAVRTAEPQIRLTIAPPTPSPNEKETTPEAPPNTPTEQSVPATPASPALPDEEVWRKALDDLFRNTPGEGRLQQWLEGLSPASVVRPPQDEAVWENSFEELGSTSSPSSIWSYAGLVVGIGAISATELRTRYRWAPAERAGAVRWKALS